MSKCDDFSSSQTNCDAINYWYLKMLFNFLLLLLLSSPCGLCCLFVFVVVIVFICLFSYETKECYLLESERTDRDLIDRDLHTINFASGQKFVKYFKNQRLCFYFDYWCCCCRCWCYCFCSFVVVVVDVVVFVLVLLLCCCFCRCFCSCVVVFLSLLL